MAEREIERWVTWNGRRIPIYKGESKADVANRLKEGAKKGKEKETTKIQNIKNRVAKKEALDKARKKSSQKGNAWANNPTERRKKSYEEATKNAQKAGEEFYERAMKGKVDAKFHKSVPADPAKARKMQREAKEAEKANQPTEDFIKKLDKNGVAVTKDKELADKYAANKNPNFHFDVKKTKDGYEVKATRKSAEPEKKVDTTNITSAKNIADLHTKLQERGLTMDPVHADAIKRGDRKPLYDGEKVSLYDKDGNEYRGTYNKYYDGGTEIVDIKKTGSKKSVEPEKKMTADPSMGTYNAWMEDIKTQRSLPKDLKEEIKTLSNISVRKADKMSKEELVSTLARMEEIDKSTSMSSTARVKFSRAMEEVREAAQLKAGSIEERVKLYSDYQLKDYINRHKLNSALDRELKQNNETKADRKFLEAFVTKHSVEDRKKYDDYLQKALGKKEAPAEKEMSASERYRKSVQDLKKQARDLSDADLDKKIKGASAKEARILQAEKDRRAKGGSNKDAGHGLREVKLANGKTMYKDQNGHWVKKEQAEKILGKKSDKKAESKPVEKKPASLIDVRNTKRGRELIDQLEEAEEEMRGRGLTDKDNDIWVSQKKEAVQALKKEFGYDWERSNEAGKRAPRGYHDNNSKIRRQLGDKRKETKVTPIGKTTTEKTGSKFNAAERASYLNNISKLRNGGDRKNEDWRVARQMFDQAPTGTVMISKGERGSEFQYKKLADGSWEYMAGAYKGDKTDSKTMSMGWAGRTGHSPSVEFTTEKAMKAKAEKARSQAEAKIKKAANLPNIKSNKSVLTRSGDKMYLDLDPSDMSPAKIKELEKKGWKRRGLSNDTWYYGG